mmetsp:Transcript_21483/g.87675  ORF Transcript_21483/g.87675 Transcript_21483/m.87675 type:complete len:492 (-) Transcript_21483:54-1529(-)
MSATTNAMFLIEGEEWKAAVDGFEHAIDLVKFIRQQYGDYFSITVAGYPEGHPDGYLADKISYEEELANLKAKVDAGADVIITQMFFDVDLFLKFVKKCRDAGIMVPIVPGILPLMSYNGFQKMTGFCKTAVPPELSEALEQVKGDDAAVKDLGIRYGVDMCRKILKSGLCPGIHFYTLNTENSVMAMVDALGFVSSTEAIRSLPFRKSTFDPRRTERVRPIYWANRFKSYLFRTTNWEKYPEIQWTNGAARMFLDPPKENILNNVDATPEAAKKLLEHYGELDSIAAVQAMFAKYYSKELANFPWCEKDGLYEQASLLKSQLLWMCKLGLLPINAQARANGIPSSDPVLGWGAKNGLVYQKAYVEFFAPKDQLEALIESAKEHPTVSISALSSQTDTIVPKTMDFATAATWGVFPNHEILQPWVLDPVSFKAWSDEAFGIWRSLAIHYGLGSTSSKTINRVADTYYLVSMLDNDYAQGDIFKVIAESIRN